jgi:hypothetical protein
VVLLALSALMMGKRRRRHEAPEETPSARHRQTVGAR